MNQVITVMLELPEVSFDHLCNLVLCTKLTIFVVLCMPTYVFVNMKWTGTFSDDFSMLKWGPNNGAMFTLGPDYEKNLSGNKLFPAGFCSIVNPYW